MGLKQARSWFVFPREFFVSGVTCSARAPSVALVWRLETAAWRHREKLSSAIVEFVAPLRLWHSLRPPPMVGFVVRVQRAGFQVSLARVWARRYEFMSTRELQEGRERARRSRLVFSTVRFGRRPPAADRIRLSVWGGAPPMSMVFWGHAHSSSDI